MLPVVGYNLLQSIDLLGSAARTFTEKCVAGLDVDAIRCEANVEKSLATCTALPPPSATTKPQRLPNRLTNRAARSARLRWK